MPSGSLRTEIDINAPPEAVWAVLSDGASFPDWNPFILRFEGELKAGGKMTMTAKPTGKSAGTFTPKLLIVEPGKELRWRGSLPIPGLFTGTHYFLLASPAAGKTHLVHGEDFTGLLIPLLGGLLRATEDGFKAMNAALKERVEARA